jgi:hypothetical protein
MNYLPVLLKQYIVPNHVNVVSNVVNLNDGARYFCDINIDSSEVDISDFISGPC